MSDTTPITTTNTFNIPECNLHKLKRELKRLDKRASKLGLPGLLSYSFGESFSKEIERSATGDFGISAYTYRVVIVYTPVTITVSGDILLPGGWHLVASLDHRSADTPIIKGVPGEEIPHLYRTRKSICEHCSTNRVRNDTFVIRNSEGEYKQVGRTCIADYLGSKDALAIAQYYVAIADKFFSGDELDEDYMSFRRVDEHWKLDDCLAFVSAIIRADGWVPRSSYNGAPTADIAWEWLSRNFEPYTVKGRYGHSETITPPTVESSDKERAAESLKWLANYESPTDYIYNCQAISTAGYATKRTIGIAASIISSYARATERELKRKQRESERGPSEHFGEPKRRERGVVVDVTGASPYESQYGSGMRVSMVTVVDDTPDTPASDLVWFGTGEAAHKLEAGRRYVVDLTVKKHDEFRGRKQTIVNRVAIKSEAEAK